MHQSYIILLNKYDYHTLHSIDAAWLAGSCARSKGLSNRACATLCVHPGMHSMGNAQHQNAPIFVRISAAWDMTRWLSTLLCGWGIDYEAATALSKGKWQTFVPWSEAQQDRIDWQSVPKEPDMMCCPAPRIESCYRRSIYEYNYTAEALQDMPGARNMSSTPN